MKNGERIEALLFDILCILNEGRELKGKISP